MQKFHRIAIETNEDGRILAPNLHDQEVKGIKFGTDSVCLMLSGRRAIVRRDYKVIGRGYVTMSLTTNHTQNVIFDVYCFDRKAESPHYERELELLYGQAGYALPESDRRRILLFTPASGVELAVICDEIAFEEAEGVSAGTS